MNIESVEFDDAQLRTTYRSP